MRGVEVQKRGALHDHAIVWSPVPMSLAVVRELAIRAGFGHSVDLAPCKAGPNGVPAYVTKAVAGYVTKATDARHEVPWLPEGTIDDGTYLVDDVSGEVLGRSPSLHGAPYRTWSCSRSWGLTMAAVRAEGRVYAIARQEELVLAAVRLLATELGAVIACESPPAPS